MPQPPLAPPSAPESYRTALRAFVADAFKGYQPADDEDIFETGHVDSLFAMELLTFVEGTFGVTIETEDLELDNFRTIERLSALVDRKTRGS